MEYNTHSSHYVPRMHEAYDFDATMWISV